MRDVNEPTTDRKVLTEQAYADSGNLNARASIYAFKEPDIDFWAWVLGLVDWPDGGRVLDVGCGPGNYLAALGRGVGLDLSEGMAREARRHAPTLVGDVCRLPVATGAVDRLLAPHMLYHAPDLDLAASELRRVLAPGGVALVVTNARDHLGHLVAQLGEATGSDAPRRFNDRFKTDDGGELLQRHFGSVDLVDLVGRLVVPEVEPVVRYADSCRANYEPQLAAGRTWPDAMARFRTMVEREVATNGAWDTVTHSGAFVCRP